MKPNHTAAPHSPAGPLSTVDLDKAEAVHIARQLPRSTPLHIDCARLACQRTLGVGYVVSQLLLLRQAGVTVWLRNVNAPLRRCLRLLGLSPLFHLSDPS
jgi:anti-anti-sigma regulatory factor